MLNPLAESSGKNQNWHHAADDPVKPDFCLILMGPYSKMCDAQILHSKLKATVSSRLSLDVRDR